MSKILDLAKNFEQTSKEQAKVTEQNVSEEFKKHEQRLIDLLKSNEQAINNAIQEQNKRILLIMLNSWSVVAIAVITVILVAGLTLAWQGKKISENLDQIAQQIATIADLADKGGNIKMDNCIDDKNRKRLCIQVNKTAGMYENNYMIPMGY